MEQARLQGIKESLERELVSVERQLAEYGVEVGEDRVELPVGEGGFADSAQVTAGRSELLSFVEGLQSHQTELREALGRIDKGTYGKCERCGAEIPLERLEAIPTARLCVTCKQSAA